VDDTLTQTDDSVSASDNPSWLIPLPAMAAAPSSTAQDTEVVPDTAGGTALKSAAAGVVPARVAAAGALEGAEIGRLIPGLGEIGIGELGGAFIGAIAGSIAASKGQSAVLSKVAPKAEEQLAVNEQAHPIASAIGDIASSLPAFEFAPGQTVDGVVAAWKAARGVALDKEGKDALMALAAQSGMATAGSVVAPLVQGQAPDLKDVGINLLTALTFGKPWFSDTFKKLGNRSYCIYNRCGISDTACRACLISR
jgi:hypothetical protein